MREPFLVNPRHRRRGGFLGRMRGHGMKRNPFGEEVMIVGANPRRHRRSRGFSLNPAGSLAMVTHAGGIDWAKQAAPAGVAAVAMVAARIVPNMIAARGWIMPDAKWKLYGLQFVSGAGGAILLRKAGKGQYATAWAIGTLAAIIGDLLATYVLPTLGLSGPVVYASYPAVNVGAYPSEVNGPYGVGAYPQEVSGLGTSPYDNTATAYPY